MKLILIVLLLAPAISFAGSQSYKAPITRNGATTVRTIYSYWSGEYPGPVINVNAADKSGVTTVEAYTSLRDLSGKVSCTIKNGAYHPWSHVKKSDDIFYTVMANNEYKATKNTTLAIDDGTTVLKIKKGTVINEIYDSEGFCSGAVKGVDQYFECSALEAAGFKKISAEDDFYEQWIYMSCDEGYKAFIQDQELLRQTGDQTGDFADYGTVVE